MSLVITGSPGVGKHTVARMLGRMHETDVLDLNELAVESEIAQESEDSLDVDVARLGRLVAKTVTGNPIVVGHLAPYVLTESRVRRAIVLRKSPYELEDVYKRRGYSESKTVANQGGEILGIVAYDAMVRFGRGRTVQIDTTGMTVRDAVGAADDALAGRRAEDEIDWLSLVSSRGDLRRFFPID